MRILVKITGYMLAVDMGLICLLSMNPVSFGLPQPGIINHMSEQV
jgi:hypothetical protein